jgi:hypothetical protein
MVTYKCCKCGAINKAQKVSGVKGKSSELLASGPLIEEKTLMFNTQDQDEFIKIYEDKDDTGKWD